MKQKNTFTRGEQEYPILFFITIILTFMLSFLFYDRFFHRKYFKNTNTLIHILETKSYSTLTGTYDRDWDIYMYDLVLNNGEKYRLWVYYDHMRVTLGDDLIGLYATSLTLKKRHRKIINMLSELS